MRQQALSKSSRGIPRSPAHNRDQHTPSPGGNRARSDEDLHRPVPLLTEDPTPNGRPAAALKQQTRDNRADDGRNALEDRRAAQGDAQVLRPAARTVERGVGPSRREATTLAVV